MIVVSDASPIISLSAVGRLDLLKQLYEKVLVPASVQEEIASPDDSERTPDEGWIPNQLKPLPASA